jgi:hypothetical protein
MRYAALALNGVLARWPALPGAGADAQLHAQHDGRPRLHGAGGDDLRQVAPGGRAGACLLFGFWTRWRSACRAWRCRASGQVPVQAIQALPYLMTVVLLAGFIGRRRAPKALGIAYVKER